MGRGHAFALFSAALVGEIAPKQERLLSVWRGSSARPRKTEAVYDELRVVFAPGAAPSQPQQVPGMPKKIEEPKLCVFCSIQ
jgi:hypothetical protein